MASISTTPWAGSCWARLYEFFSDRQKCSSVFHKNPGNASSDDAPKIKWRRRSMKNSTSCHVWKTSSLRLGFCFKRRMEENKVDNFHDWSYFHLFRDVNHTQLQQEQLDLSKIMNEQTVMLGFKCHFYIYQQKLFHWKMNGAGSKNNW